MNKIAKLAPINFFLKNDKAYKLVLKCLLLLLIPYAFLMLCGLVFDLLLNWYFMTTYIFIVLIIITLIALALITWSIISFVRKKG